MPNPPPANAQVVPPPPTLSIRFVSRNVAAYGQFDYKIKWVLTERAQVDMAILQKVTISCLIKDENDNVIDISQYTNNDCLWKTCPMYWEVWFIRAQECRPTYYGQPKVPSFDALATVDNRFDDNYSTGSIYSRQANPNANVYGITKGWVQYKGEAELYRVPDLVNWDANWQNKFHAYNANQASPAGVLPYNDHDPMFPPQAMEGAMQKHNMVAYWNSCWPRHRSNRTTRLELDPAGFPYSDADMWAKVESVGPNQQAQSSSLSGSKRKTVLASKGNLAASNKKRKIVVGQTP